MRTAVTAFFLGAAAVAALAVGASLVVALLAEASGREELRVAVADLELLSFERRRGRSETAFGPALVLLPLAGGLLNGLAAALLLGRGRSAP